MKIIEGLIVVLCGETVCFCAVVSNQWLMDGASATLILLLNIFFIIILSQLNGSLPLKAAILIGGNFLGTALNLLFYALAENVYALIGLSICKTLTLTFPILNFVWIVPFWSLSLSLLTKPSITGKGHA